jgi:hypothetical protein
METRLLSIEEQRALIAEEIATYEKMRDDLEANHLNEWVVIYKGELIGTYLDFQEAAADAVQRFGRGPYLIRQVGVERIVHAPFSITNARR